MNGIETLLDKPIFQALGWTLIHFIWQGCVIALLYAVASLLLRKFSANVRYAAACAAMLLMFVAPVVTMIVVRSSIDGSTPMAINSESESTLAPQDSALSTQDSSLFSQSPIAQINDAPEPQSLKLWVKEKLPHIIPWFLALWFTGVIFLTLRFAGGLITVNRLKRQEICANSSLLELQEMLSKLASKLRVSRPVKLCRSALVEVPTVIGWLRPVILLPATALTGLTPTQLEALLAHELAHIRRYDYLVNLLQTTIETLFFYHPLVWWVSAQVRQEREHCCDDLAVAACGDVLTYARALTTLEQLRRSEPQLAVAASGGSLLVRIQRLVRGRAPAVYGFQRGLAGFLAVATIFILLVGAQTVFQTRQAKASALEETTQNEPVEGPINSTLPAPSVKKAVRSSEPAEPKQPESTGKNEPTDDSTPISDVNVDPAASPSQEIAGAESSDYVVQLVNAGLKDLKPSQVNALRSNQVTPRFVREMTNSLGTNLNANTVITMWIHGVNADFVSEMGARGLSGLTPEQLVAFRIHGVTAQYMDELRSVGCPVRDPGKLVAFRIHGVSPASIRQLTDLGFGNLSSDQLVAFAVHGVTPLFIQSMRTFIRGKFSADDLIALRIHGVTPEMIKELEIMGFPNLSADRLLAVRIHGVTPAFIRSIQEAGYNRVTIDELIELRINGVTAEFIQLVKSRGFTDATLHQLSELRRLNILPTGTKN
jgi:beta-lactamase regulating signal transducer with metallopeptidase domain